MEEFVKGDVVVLPFPFSDLSQNKRRPALIVAEAGLVLESDRDDLRLRVTLAVREDDRPVFDRTWELAAARDLL